MRGAPTLPNELSHDLTAPTNCDNCHEFANPAPLATEPAVAPYDSWAGSMMANAARDPVFWAGVAIASQDAPTQTELCIRCHSPRGFLEGREDSIAITELAADDLFSVECEMCHRMIDEGNIGNAQYTIDDNAVGGHVPRRGPWTYAGSDPPHPWIQDSYIGSSEQCGTCHDVTTPTERVDDLGVGLGVPFNEQRTYSEWLGSDLAVPGPGFASCQDCHMPAVSDVAGCANFVGGGEHPSGGRRHDLAGANQFVLQLLQATYGDSGTMDVSDAAYDHAIARTQETLASAATLEVWGPAIVDLGMGFDLDVTVTNQTGHKLPTGYAEGRVMWLEVVAVYAGQVLYTSGHWDAGVIEQDPQLRTYEGVAEQWSTGAGFHLMLNDHWVSDTRIPPAGLLPDPETDPITNRYPLLPGGTWAHWDDVSYAFDPTWGLPDATPADPSDDELEITVRLRYLINTPEYVVFLETANVTNSAGLDLAAMFTAAGNAPAMILAEQTVVAELTGFDAVPPMGTTGTTGEVGSTGDMSSTGSASTTGDTSGSTGDAGTTEGSSTSGIGTSGIGTSGDASTSSPVDTTGGETSGMDASAGGDAATDSMEPGTTAESSAGSTGAGGDGSSPATTDGCACSSTPERAPPLLPWLLVPMLLPRPTRRPRHRTRR
ncbi:MAG: hypothetical protein KC501_36215 [Myxococcales bacterium]|nr:hypothetical protein [Myxococcales bacterium]